jgi:hypothetical protein
MVRVPPRDNLSTALLATGMAGGVGLAVHAGPRQCWRPQNVRVEQLSADPGENWVQRDEPRFDHGLS